ncbi:MAG: hypothetical protein AB1696_28870 [Planctomycetota bacterium]
MRPFLRGMTGLVLLGMGATVLAADPKPLPFTATTRHYFIETDTGQDAADEIGDFMEVMYAAYLGVFKSIKPNWEARLKVRILKNREDYIEEVGENMAWSSGVYRGRERGILTSLGNRPASSLRGILQHEGFHQFFDKFIGRGATWVNEGLATYFGSGIIDGNEIRFGAVHERTLQTVIKAMDEGKALTLKELLLITGKEWSERMGGEEKSPQYSQVMLLIHFLVHGYDGRNIPVLNKYLMLQKRGIQGEEALATAFGRDFGLFEKKWHEYVHGLKPYEPPSCTRNLERLGMLLRFSRKEPGLPKTMDEFYEQAVSGKIRGWRITLPDGRKVASENTDVIKEWFRCPDAKANEKVSYELEPPEKEGGDPCILCDRHKPYTLRARTRPRPDGKGDYTDVEQERKGRR